MTEASRVDRGLRSLRRRLTAVAVLTVAVVLAVTGLVLVTQQRSRVLDGVDDALRIRAGDVATALGEGEGSVRLRIVDVEDQAAQVVTLDGQVVAASVNLAGQPPIAPAPGGDEEVRTLSDLAIEDDDFRVLSRRVSIDGRVLVVHVAENVDEVADSTRVLIVLLVVAFPLVLLVLGGLTWWVVGRTLRPVRAASLRQERFVADASHELRSPLARMRTRLEVDLAHPEGIDLEQTATDVLGETVGMQRLVDGMLELARRDAGPPDDDRREPVDLDDVVLAEADALRRARPELTVQVSEVSGATVVGRRSGLVRLVRNIVENAGQHAATTVRLALREVDGTARLVVDDDGPGIPPDQVDSVFGRFTRLDPARRADGGAGLGLAIAREIVVDHGGAIRIVAADLGGARVEVTLPASP